MEVRAHFLGSNRTKDCIVRVGERRLGERVERPNDPRQSTQ